MPDISNGRSSDFFFMDAGKIAEKAGSDASESSAVAEETARTIVDLVKNKLPKYYRIPSSGIQVLTPMLMNHYVMLQRNLIYTGITRAKKILVAVGTKKAMAYAIRNVTVEKRGTMHSGI